MTGIGNPISKSSIAMICLAVVLICTCQPRSLTRFDNGSSMATVVGLDGLSMKRMPRTPRPASRLSSASVTLESTTAIARALAPSVASASSVQLLSVP